MMKELNIAIKAAKESGKILLKYYKKNLNIVSKSDNTPVTRADKESEKKIVSIIKKAFPDHNFLCEELKYKKTNSEFTWIIDPLDGTKRFIRGIPFFGNSIALEKNGKIILGVIYMPAAHIFAYASKGHGTFINGKRTNVSAKKNIEESFLAHCSLNRFYKDGYGKQVEQLITKSYDNKGYGDVLMYMFLAQGFIDVVLDIPKPWDIAAAKIIIEEAGGKLTDFHGNDTIYTEHSVATNGKLHNKVLEILRK